MAQDGSNGPRLRPAERYRLILAELTAGNGHVGELSATLDVSPSTIRRDLSRLREQGEITRTYGGAVLGPHRPERPLGEKALANPAQKAAIAKLAASLVDNDATVILDAGTTTGCLAAHLASRQGLTVVTNGLSALSELAEADGVETILLGGQLRRINQALLGPMTESNLGWLTADQAFLGAEALTADKGICSPSMPQSHLKRLMTERAQEVFVLADGSKFGSAPFPYWTPMTRPYTVVTDSDASAEALEPFVRNPFAKLLLAEVRVDAVTARGR